MTEHEYENKEKPENVTAEVPFFKREKVQRALIWLRYLLPPFTAVLLVVLGLFYNVYSLQLGQRVQVSVLQLWFNTLKAMRSYALDGNAVAGTRNFYIFLAISAALVALLFLVGILYAGFMIYVLRRVARAHAQGDREAEKEAKILLHAFLPNRIWVAVTNVLLLPLALFPEIFALICGRFLTVSGGSAIHIRFNVVALVIGVLILCTIALAVYTRRLERIVGPDPFTIDVEADGEAEVDDEENAQA